VPRGACGNDPSARIVYRYRLVADGFRARRPTREVGHLTSIPGIAKVWPNVAYHELSVTRTRVTRANQLNQGPQVIGADKLWGAGFATAGEGMKIGVIDDGIDARHVFFDPSTFSYPSGFPKGLTSKTTPKVIVFANACSRRARPRYSLARSPFDPSAKQVCSRDARPPGSPRASPTPRTARSCSRVSRPTLFSGTTRR
jgi:hypothetical protein